MGKQKTFEHRAAIAASRIGVSLAEYLARQRSEQSWCGVCRQWLPFVAFNRRGRGVVKLHSTCKLCAAARAKARATA